MKIDSMRKKEGLLASRLESDQKRLETERRRDVFQGDCSKSKEIDEDNETIDNDHSNVRDGMMREADVGRGLSGTLSLLREQGTFKEKKRKLVDVKDDYKDDDRFRDRFKDIRIERVDAFEKEAYRSLCHIFHGKKPGKRKQEKRKRKQEDKLKVMESSFRAVERMRQVHAELKSSYIVL